MAQQGTTQPADGEGLLGTGGEGRRGAGGVCGRGHQCAQMQGAECQVHARTQQGYTVHGDADQSKGLLGKILRPPKFYWVLQN